MEDSFLTVISSSEGSFTLTTRKGN